MKTNLFAFATLAATLGLASWSAGAADSYTARTSTSDNAPVYTADLQAAKSRTAGADDKKSAEVPSNAAGRAALGDRTFKFGVTPANMFNLRDNAGG